MGKFVETADVVYHLCLPSKKKTKPPFSISVGSKQTEVCRFLFPFAASRRELSFPVSSISQIIYIYTENGIIYI
jgi:hypothetical protein